MSNLDILCDKQLRNDNQYGDIINLNILETEIVQCPECNETFGYNPATQTDIFCPFCDKKMEILAC